MEPGLKESLERCLAARPEVAFATVFGSRAGGRPRPGSDLDVAVHFGGRLDAKQRFRARLDLTGELEEAVGRRVDLVVLDDAPPLLAHRALAGERVLVRDRTAYVRFFVRTLGESGDERHWRDLHRRERRRRLAEGRFGRP